MRKYLAEAFNYLLVFFLLFHVTSVSTNGSIGLFDRLNDSILLFSNRSVNLDNSGEIYVLMVLNDHNKETTEDGWLVPANKLTKIFLIGNEFLTKDDLITFSAFKHDNPDSDSESAAVCAPDTSFNIEIIERRHNLTFAQAYIKLPSVFEESWSAKIFGHLDTYHICLKQSNSAEFKYPRNTFSQAKIKVFQEPLPIWMKIGFSIIGFVMSFYLSGLVLGIMAIDITDLQILMKAGKPDQKRHAHNLYPIRKNGNRILCTLLLSNVAANSLVTVFLNNLIDSGWQTFVVSTLTLCVIGEIIPQAVFNRHGFFLAAKSIIFIRVLLYLTAPFAYPVGILLDRALGAEAGMAYTRKQIRQLIELQYETGNLKLHETEMHILQSALAMQKSKVETLMTRIGKVFMIDINSHLDFSSISAIMSSGFTRIPIFKNDRTNIVGILNAKDLAVINPDDNMSLEAFRLCYKTAILCVPQDLSIIKLLQEFIKGKSHLAFVYRRVSKIENQNEMDGSDRDDSNKNEKENKTRRKRTTSNLSASLGLEYFLCNGTNHKNLKQINEQETFIPKRRSLVPDSGIFLVTGDEELPDHHLNSMKHIIGIITLEDIFELILQEKIFDEKDLDPSTLKSSQKDFTLLTQNNVRLPIYEKYLYAASQFLSSSLVAFSPKYLSATSLHNLLRSNIHSFTPTIDNFEYKLYKQNTRANYFILVLSGVADVVIGKDNLKFSAHNFSYFGEQAILAEDEIKKETMHTDLLKDLKFLPDFSLTLRDKCVFIKITRQSYVDATLHQIKKKKSIESVNASHEVIRAKLLNDGVSKLMMKKNSPQFMDLKKKNNQSKDTKNIHAKKHVKTPSLGFEVSEKINLQPSPARTPPPPLLSDASSDDEITRAYLLANKT